MKNHLSIRLILIGLVLGSASLCASCAATKSFTAASRHAGQASGQLLTAGGNSVVGSLQAGSAVAAVPLWMGGAAVGGAGALSQAIGDGAARTGEATMKGGDKLWDFGSGDPAERPALDRTRALPPAALPPSVPPRKDPSPAEAMNRM